MPVECSATGSLVSRRSAGEASRMPTPPPFMPSMLDYWRALPPLAFAFQVS